MVSIDGLSVVIARLASLSNRIEWKQLRPITVLLIAHVIPPSDTYHFNFDNFSIWAFWRLNRSAGGEETEQKHMRLGMCSEMQLQRTKWSERPNTTNLIGSWSNNQINFASTRIDRFYIVRSAAMLLSSPYALWRASSPTSQSYNWLQYLVVIWFEL